MSKTCLFSLFCGNLHCTKFYLSFGALPRPTSFPPHCRLAWQSLLAHSLCCALRTAAIAKRRFPCLELTLIVNWTRTEVLDAATRTHLPCNVLPLRVHETLRCSSMDLTHSINVAWPRGCKFAWTLWAHTKHIGHHVHQPKASKGGPSALTSSWPALLFFST